MFLITSKSVHHLSSNEYDEDIVQTTNCKGSENYSSMKISRLRACGFESRHSHHKEFLKCLGSLIENTRNVKVIMKVHK